jgi:phospholipid/cholesterol/gamma-HCH transport system substrate-binding protein
MEPIPAERSGLRLQLRVGAFILTAFAIFVALVYGLGQQTGLFERQYQLRAGFSQTGGLLEGAMVRLAGVPVGHVSAIRLPDPGGSRVQVELTIVRRVLSQIREDSVARIETQGLLGDKIVELTLGSPAARALPEGAEVQTEEPLDTARLAKQGTELLRNLVEVSSELRAAIGKVTESSVGPDLAETVRALRALATEIERGQGALGRLVYDRRLGSAVADAAAAIGRLGRTTERLDRLLADPKTEGALAAAGQALAEAREAASRVNRVLRQVEEGPGFLHALIYDEGRLLRDLDRLLARADTLTASLERGEGALGVLLRDADTARGVRRVVRAAEGLAEAVDEARASDSVLRALLGESTIAANLRETARHFREVTARLARGEGLLGRLTTPGSDELGRELARALGVLGGLADDARLGETLSDLRAAMASLRAVTARIEAGEGTLGGLAVDPTVYENLAAFLEGAQRSLLLRALIRATIPSGPPERTDP